jgi:hypothetical protein
MALTQMRSGYDDDVDRSSTMKQIRLLALYGLVAIVLVVGLLAPAPTSGAQTSGGYDLTWNTVDGGGGASSGGGYTLSGTIGQPDAGKMSSGTYTLDGGFWAAVSQVLQRLYLPLLTR